MSLQSSGAWSSFVAGRGQVELDLGSPEDPASEPAWLAALSALTELGLVANGMGGTRAVG